MTLQKGDKAPLFEGKDQHGNRIALSDFLGKKVVLYFYPKDNTPGCTAQACDLRDNYDALLQKGYVVLGVSRDSEEKHRKFIAQYKLPFSLIADTDASIHQLYGTIGEKKMFGISYIGTHRMTFIIDENGIIEEVISKVKTFSHSKQLL